MHAFKKIATAVRNTKDRSIAANDALTIKQAFYFTESSQERLTIPRKSAARVTFANISSL